MFKINSEPISINVDKSNLISVCNLFQMYYHDNNKIMKTPAVSQLISTVLYYRRFMPYLVYNLLAGLDGDGKGCVYSYDPIGHCERSMFRAVGSSGALLQPLLDNQVSTTYSYFFGYKIQLYYFLK